MSIKTPVQASNPGGPERAPVASPDLLADLNRDLASSTESEFTAEFSAPDLAAYIVRNGKLPGATFKSLKADAHHGILEIEGEIMGDKVGVGFAKASPGNARFTVEIENGEDGRLSVYSHHLDLGRAFKAFKGKIEDRITNFDETVAETVNKRLAPGWEVSGIRIREDNLIFAFKKAEGTVVVTDTSVDSVAISDVFDAEAFVHRLLDEDESVGIASQAAEAPILGGIWTQMDAHNTRLEAAQMTPKPRLRYGVNGLVPAESVDPTIVFSSSKASIQAARSRVQRTDLGLNSSSAQSLVEVSDDPETTYGYVASAIRRLHDRLDPYDKEKVWGFLQEHYRYEGPELIEKVFGGKYPNTTELVEEAAGILSNRGVKELPILTYHIVYKDAIDALRKVQPLELQERDALWHVIADSNAVDLSKLTPAQIKDFYMHVFGNDDPRIEQIKSEALGILEEAGALAGYTPEDFAQARVISEVNPDDFVGPVTGVVNFAGYSAAKRSFYQRIKHPDSFQYPYRRSGFVPMVGRAAYMAEITVPIEVAEFVARTAAKGGKETAKYGWRHRVQSALMLGVVGIGVISQMGLMPEPITHSAGFAADMTGGTVSRVGDVTHISSLVGGGQKFEHVVADASPEQTNTGQTNGQGAAQDNQQNADSQDSSSKIEGIKVTTGNLPDTLTVKLIDLVGADIQPSVPVVAQPAANDLAVDIKIVPVENQTMSTFDWSVAKAFQRIGINLIDGNNPTLNGAARWQLTTMIAHSMGVEPSQLNKVYMGDTFKGIKITPEMVKFVQAQNVTVPDSVLQMSGLASVPVSDLRPVESPTIVVPKAPEAKPPASGEVKTPNEVSGAAGVYAVNGRVDAKNNVYVDPFKSGEYEVTAVQKIDGQKETLVSATSSEGTFSIPISDEIAREFKTVLDTKGTPKFTLDLNKDHTYLVKYHDATGKQEQTVLAPPAVAAALKKKQEQEDERFKWFLAALGLFGLAGLDLGTRQYLKSKGYDPKGWWFKKKDDDDDDDFVIGAMA